MFSCQRLHVVLELLKLFLLKWGGEEIYVGPLGDKSCHLIKYFEVRFVTHLLSETSIV
jgi:hypothetical protein